MFLYLNGEYIHQNNAFISPFDHGYLYGIGAFETIRIYQGHPFLLDDHLKRLNESLKHLNISCSIERDFALNVIKKLLYLNDLQDAYLRINVSAGESDLGLTVQPYEKSTIIFFMKDIQIPENQTKEAVFLKLRRNLPEGKYRIKSHHFLNNMLAKREIGLNPNMEGFFLTHDGYVAEGIVSNIFWVKENSVFTPSIETGILNGITRQFILKVLENIGLTYREGWYKPEELLMSKEVFVTNSLQEIVPITKIGERTFLGISGHITQQLKSIYAEYRHRLYSRHQLKVGDSE